MNNQPAILLFGPSGAGKSHLARALDCQLGWLWIEADIFKCNDPLDVLGLHAEWSELRRQRARPLRDTLRMRATAACRRGVVLSFASGVTLAAHKMEKAEADGLHSVILFGTKDECRSAFEERERQTARGLAPGHWDRFNAKSYRKFSAPEVERFRLAAFVDGKRRATEELLADVIARIGTPH